MDIGKVWYSCPNCGAAFWKAYVFGTPKELVRCPHCGGNAHRNRLKELTDDLNNRIGI